MREIRTLRARRRGLETELRITLGGHEGGNPGHRQGNSYGPPRQSSTLPRCPEAGPRSFERACPRYLSCGDGSDTRMEQGGVISPCSATSTSTRLGREEDQTPPGPGPSAPRLRLEAVE